MGGGISGAELVPMPIDVYKSQMECRTDWTSVLHILAGIGTEGLVWWGLLGFALTRLWLRL